MVDLHSHVLFNIDDGSSCLEESLDILKKAEKIGIKKIIATPHFTIGEDVDEFLDKRKRRLEALKQAMAEEGIDIKMKGGAEVYITDEIFTEDKLEQLTLGESGVILAEFKYHGVKSEDFIDYVEVMLNAGLKVLVAHPERYSYLMEKPMLVHALIDRGVMFQINAISLFEDSEEGDFARALAKEGVATVIGSDIHHAGSKRLDAVGELLKLDRDYLKPLLWDNPNKIFECSEV